MQDKQELLAAMAYNVFIIKYGPRARIGRAQFIRDFKRALQINNEKLHAEVIANEPKGRGKAAKKDYYSGIITYNRYILKSGCECNGGDFKINLRGN